MEANKTITEVGLDDHELTDEGKQASLLGMEVNFNWVVFVGARFMRLASKGAGKHTTDCWHNIVQKLFNVGECSNDDMHLRSQKTKTSVHCEPLPLHM